MNRVAGGPPLQLFERPAKVVDRLLVDELHLAPGTHDRHQGRDRVQDQPEFPLAQGELLRLLIRMHRERIHAFAREPSRKLTNSRDGGSRFRQQFQALAGGMSLALGRPDRAVRSPLLHLQRRDDGNSCWKSGSQGSSQRSWFPLNRSNHTYLLGCSHVRGVCSKRREECGSGSRRLRGRIGMGGGLQDSHEGRIQGHDRAEPDDLARRRRGGDQARAGGAERPGISSATPTAAS